MKDYTKLTLGQLLAHANETIKRNAMSILKTLQREEKEVCQGQHIENGVAYCADCEKFLY